MTCAEVQLLLSEYIEKSLDAVRMKAVEAHLLSCSGCRGETEDLTDCIQQVAEFPLLDPPIGFTQRVMAHVREIETRPSLWQRVFLPFRVGVPIQATAVVLVAVLAIFLYPRESQFRDNGISQPISSTSPAQLSDKGSSAKPAQPTESAQTVAKDTLPATSKPDAVQSPAAERKEATPRPAPAKKQEALQTQPPERVEANSAGDVKDPFARRGPIQAQEIATGMERSRPSGDPFEIGPTIGGSLRPGFFLPERSLSPITEPSADAEFIVKRRDTQRREQNSVAKSEATQQGTESGIAPAVASQPLAVPSTTVREIRWFAVPADQYDQFRKELQSEASIESEKAIGASERDSALKSNRELLIKVVIVSQTER